MKTLLLTLLAGCALQCASAQVITLRGTVADTTLGGPWDGLIAVGDDVVTTIEIKPLAPTDLSGDWSLLMYSASTTLSVGSLGEIGSDLETEYFAYKGFAGLYGFQSSLVGGDLVSSSYLLSSDASVLWGDFPITGTLLSNFDVLVFGDVELGLDLFSWNVSSVEVVSNVPVPEPSTYGLIGAGALLAAVAYRRRRR